MAHSNPRELVSGSSISSQSTFLTKPASGPEPIFSIKILVSNNVAGSIIGRSGSTISDLENQSASRIKLSQTGVYFPGTSDRVCLLQGTLQSVKSAAGLVLRKLFDLQFNASSSQHGRASEKKMPDETTGGLNEKDSSQANIEVGQGDPNKEKKHEAKTNSPQENPKPPVVSFVLRILVPYSSCGMIIGRGGSSIKLLAKKSGVSSIHISPKDVDPAKMSAQRGSFNSSAASSAAVAAAIMATSERVITINSPSVDCSLNCVCLILDDFAANPDISRYINMTTSYANPTAATASSPHALRGSLNVVQVGHRSAPSSPAMSPQHPAGTLLLTPTASQQTPQQHRYQAHGASILPPTQLYGSAVFATDPGGQGNEGAASAGAHNIQYGAFQGRGDSEVPEKETTGRDSSEALGQSTPPPQSVHSASMRLASPHQSYYVVAPPPTQSIAQAIGSQNSRESLVVSEGGSAGAPHSGGGVQQVITDSARSNIPEQLPGIHVSPRSYPLEQSQNIGGVHHHQTERYAASDVNFASASPQQQQRRKKNSGKFGRPHKSEK